MSFEKNTGRQAPAVAIVDFTYADFVSGTFLPMIDLASTAVVIGGACIIDTAFNSSSSDTGTVGDKTTDDRYKSGINFAATGYTALVPTGVKVDTADKRQFGIKWTGSGDAPTAGAGRLIVQYIIPARADFAEPA